jgi:dTDP-4-dehydrorhamnose reductase
MLNVQPFCACSFGLGKIREWEKLPAALEEIIGRGRKSFRESLLVLSRELIPRVANLSAQYKDEEFSQATRRLTEVLRNDFEVWTTIRKSINEYKKTHLFVKEKTIQELDVDNIHLIEENVINLKPEIIINAIGIIKQLPNSKNVISTLTINSIFPHHLAELAKKYNAYLLQISTDCVFSGSKGNYTEEDIPDAQDLYGKSKNLGEVIADNCLTIRTSIIGRELNTKHSLLEWFLNNPEKKIKGYNNAIFSGFPTIILAEIIGNLITRNKRLEGLYHISSEPIDKFNLLRLVKEKYKVDIEIEPFGDFKIDRSLNSDKFRKETGFKPLGWEKMIEVMAEDSIIYKDINNE